VSVTKAQRKLAALATTVSFALIGTASAATPIAVKATAWSEASPAAGGEWFAWARGQERTPSPYDVWAQRSGERAFRVNPFDTQAYTGGIDGDRLLYQLIPVLDRSDLRLYDLARRRHIPLPRGVNSLRWECCGTISGEWLLYGRGRILTKGTQLVLLHNLVTGQKRVLDTLRNKRSSLSAGQVNGNYAVWLRCHPEPRCVVKRHDIAGRETTTLPVPAGKVVYSPSVSSDGTVYYIRSNRGCGRAVELIKEPLGGAAQVLAAIPARYDVEVTYTVFRPARGPVAQSYNDVYYDRVRCGTDRWDIFRIVDPQEPPPPPP
jgi:hypothetical protein